MHFHAVEFKCPCGEFACAVERLGEERVGFQGFETLRVEPFHGVEIELALKVARSVLPLPDTGLVGLFLGNETNGVDALVHADGVFPVVGRLCELAVVFDSHCLTGSHMA